MTRFGESHPACCTNKARMGTHPTLLPPTRLVYRTSLLNISPRRCVSSPAPSLAANVNLPRQGILSTQAAGVAESALWMSHTSRRRARSSFFFKWRARSRRRRAERPKQTTGGERRRRHGWAVIVRLGPCTGHICFPKKRVSILSQKKLKKEYRSYSTTVCA